MNYYRYFSGQNYDNTRPQMNHMRDTSPYFRNVETGVVPPMDQVPPEMGMMPPASEMPPEMGMVPPTSEMPPEMGVIPPIGEEPPEMGMIPPIGEIPPEMGVIPPIGEIPPEMGIIPPIGEEPPEMGMIPPIGEEPPEMGMVPPGSGIPSQIFPPIFPPNMIQHQLQICMNSVIYVSMKNGEVFWFYPTNIENLRVYGYRWGWRNGWHNYNMPVWDIRGAYCYVTN